MALFFNGRLWVTPVAMAVVDDTQMYNRNLSVGNVLAIVGNGSGGVKKTIYRFGSAEEARTLFKAGALVDAIGKAFDPSSQTYGPTTVIAIKADDSTPATLTLKDAAAANTITLTASDTGSIGNRVQVKIETATGGKGKKVSTQFDTTIYSKDNLFRDLFTVQYSGSGSGATVSCDGTKFTIFDGTVSIDFDFVTYGRIVQLVRAINTVANWTAHMTANARDIDTETIDLVTAAPAKTAAYQASANVQALLDWLNAPRKEGFVTAAFSATSTNKIPANIDWTRLAGGNDGAPVAQDWQDCFDLLQNEDIQWVVPLTGNPAVHAMVDSHVTYMSNIARKNRRAIVGGPAAASDDDALTAAENLNSDRTGYVHLGYWDYDQFGKFKLFAPYYTAALLGGMFSGVDPGTALTNKAIKIRGVERDVRNPTDTDVLINGGVIAIEKTREGYKVVRSVSTWLINDNYNRVEISCGVALDFVVQNIINAVRVLIGERNSPATMVRAEQICDSTLRELARPQPMGPEVIVGNADSPPWRGLTVTAEGDVLRIEFECSPVIPVNYIPVVIHAVPFSGTITQAGQ